MVIKANRFNKLLKAGNPLLMGFLYGKFIDIEKLGIKISYQVSIGELDVGIPVYKLVEMLGNLIKNAVEAIQDSDDLKELFVSVVEVDGTFELEVRNKSLFISYDEIGAFFKRGFTKKGNNRGIGLYNVKAICREYSLSIFCENKILNEQNWLCFTISNKKEELSGNKRS